MTYWRLFYHFVWGTKGRLQMLDAERSVVLRQAIVEVTGEHECLIHAIGWMPDHVHLALSVPPKVAIADLAQRLKGTSSRRINERGGDAFAWQTGYGVTSFSESRLPIVIDYIDNQPAHHADRTLIPALERLKAPAPAPGHHQRS